MERTRFFTFITSIALIISGMALAAQPGRTQAQPQSAQRATTDRYQAYLPLSTYLYDASYVNPFGVVMYGTVDQASGLSQMQTAGSKRVTTILDWGTIEATEGARDWSSFDTKVRNAQSAGMEVFVLFTGDPVWAWTADRTATIPEKRLNFVQAMVQRYDCDGLNDAAGQLCVHHWSFYAEPDYYRDYYQKKPGFKGYWGNRAGEYAHMLAAVANVVHQEDPGAKVYMGGLAFDWFDTEGGPFIRSFLPDVLGTLNTAHGGAARYIDAITVHYYPLKYTSIRHKIADIRGIMQAHGVASLPILVPEMGYWSQDDSNENQQAQRLVQMFVEGLSVGVEQLSWFMVFDEGSGRGAWGLFRGQDLNSPKPSYAAYRTITRELAGAHYAGPLNQAGVEGFVFRMPNGAGKTVVWTTQAAGRAVFGGQCVRVVNKTGVVYSPIYDGNPNWDMDGPGNGQITLRVATNEPIYVAACS